jgi:hypothetical protein
VNALAESALDEIDWGGIGRLLIMIPNDEVSSLTALHFSEAFETTKIYQLAAHEDSRSSDDAHIPRHLRGRPLFGEDTSYDSLKGCFEAGHEIKVIPITEEVSQDDLVKHFEGAFVPMFVMRTPETLWVISEANQFTLQPDDKLVALVDPSYLDTLPLDAVAPSEAGTEPVAVTEDKDPFEQAASAASSDEPAGNEARNEAGEPHHEGAPSAADLPAGEQQSQS